MKKRVLATLLAAVLVIVCGACGRQGINGLPPEINESSLPPEELAIYTSIFEAAGTSFQGLEGIAGYGTASVLDAIEHFDMRFYAGWQKLREPLTMSLAQLQLDTGSREIHAADHDYQGEGEPLLLELIVSPDYGYGDGVFVKLFDSGLVELSSPRRWEESYTYRLVDVAPMEGVKETIAWIEGELQTLRYQVHFYPYREDFSDQSPVVKATVYNERGNTVYLDAIAIERLEEARWVPAPLSGGAIECSTTAIAPYEPCEIVLSLDSLENGRQEGRYRFRGTFTDGGDTVELLAEFTISDQSTNYAYPAIPEMDAEHQRYYDQYVGMWGYYNPFTENFSENGYDFHVRTYMLFNGCLHVAGMAQQAVERYGPDFPIEFVENTIQEYFLLSTDQIRANISRQPVERFESEYLDTAKGIYHFGGGYGGAGSLGVVESYAWEGDLLTLTVGWYSWEGEPGDKNRMTLRFDQFGEFKYIANEVLEP